MLFFSVLLNSIDFNDKLVLINPIVLNNEKDKENIWTLYEFVIRVIKWEEFLLLMMNMK